MAEVLNQLYTPPQATPLETVRTPDVGMESAPESITKKLDILHTIVNRTLQLWLLPEERSQITGFAVSIQDFKKKTEQPLIQAETELKALTKNLGSILELYTNAYQRTEAKLAKFGLTLEETHQLILALSNFDDTMVKKITRNSQARLADRLSGPEFAWVHRAQDIFSLLLTKSQTGQYQLRQIPSFTMGPVSQSTDLDYLAQKLDTYFGTNETGQKLLYGEQLAELQAVQQELTTATAELTTKYTQQAESKWAHLPPDLQERFQKRILFISGMPGAGKSTLYKHLTTRLWGELERQGYNLPDETKPSEAVYTLLDPDELRDEFSQMLPRFPRLFKLFLNNQKYYLEDSDQVQVMHSLAGYLFQEVLGSLMALPGKPALATSTAFQSFNKVTQLQQTMIEHGYQRIDALHIQVKLVGMALRNTMFYRERGIPPLEFIKSLGSDANFMKLASSGSTASSSFLINNPDTGELKTFVKSANVLDPLDQLLAFEAESEVGVDHDAATEVKLRTDLWKAVEELAVPEPSQVVVNQV